MMTVNLSKSGSPTLQLSRNVETYPKSGHHIQGPALPHMIWLLQQFPELRFSWHMIDLTCHANFQMKILLIERPPARKNHQ